jgi:chromosome segregation ATPase
MTAIRTENLSTFGRLALKMDEHFSELNRLSRQIGELDLDTESGVERGGKLLVQFAEHGQSISGGIQEFLGALQEAREKSEAATKLVAERALLIQKRKQEQGDIRERLSVVEREVKAANENIARSFKKDGGVGKDDQPRLKAELGRLNEELKAFLAKAQAVKEAASGANFKSIAHDAGKLIDALKSSSRKIEKALG